MTAVSHCPIILGKQHISCAWLSLSAAEHLITFMVQKTSVSVKG